MKRLCYLIGLTAFLSIFISSSVFAVTLQSPPNGNYTAEAPSASKMKVRTMVVQGDDEQYEYTGIIIEGELLKELLPNGLLVNILDGEVWGKLIPYEDGTGALVLEYTDGKPISTFYNKDKRKGGNKGSESSSPTP